MPESLLDALRARCRLRRRKTRHACGERGVADDCYSAAVRVERLERLKAEDRGIAEGADRSAVVLRAQRVRAILDDGETMPRSDRQEVVHVAWKTAKMCRHNGNGSLCDDAAQCLCGHIEGDGIHMRKDRRQSGLPRDLWHHPEGERRKDDFSTRREVERFENVIKGHPPIGSGNRVHAAQPGGKCVLEACNVRSFLQLSTCFKLVDDLNGIRDHTHAVPGNGSQHTTPLSHKAASRRACRRSTRASSEPTTLCTAGAVMRR